MYTAYICKLNLGHRFIFANKINYMYLFCRMLPMYIRSYIHDATTHCHKTYYITM